MVWLKLREEKSSRRRARKNPPRLVSAGKQKRKDFGRFWAEQKKTENTCGDGIALKHKKLITSVILRSSRLLNHLSPRGLVRLFQELIL